jgi:Tol biopolymer transport system component
MNTLLRIATTLAAIALLSPAAASAAAAPPLRGEVAVEYAETNASAESSGVLGVTRTGSRPLTTPGGGDGVAWSPDGTRFALGGRGGIVLTDADTGESTTITTPAQGVGVVSWAPDGRQLAFVGYTNFEPDEPIWLDGGGGTGDLYVINADGTDAQRLTQREEVTWIAWSARGPLAYYRSTSRPGGGSWVRDSPGAPSRRLPFPREVYRFWYSHDGRRLLAYRRVPPSGLFVADARGRRLRRLPFRSDRANWTPDGRIAFLARDLLGDWRIEARRLDGTGRRTMRLPNPAPPADPTDEPARRTYVALSWRP